MPSEKVQSDIRENTNQNILLIGSGASQSFGGLLIQEMWSGIYNNNSATLEIKKNLREFDDYETAFSKLDSEQEKKVYLDIVRDCFEGFDNEMQKSQKPYESLYKFFKLFYEDDKYNFVFTTNQDLLIERCFIKAGNNAGSTQENIENQVRISFPYNDFNLSDSIDKSGNKVVQDQSYYKFDCFKKTIKIMQTNDPVKGNYNCIKLHGSFNWWHSENYVVQITGENKASQIENSTLMNHYLVVFDHALRSKRRIVIVGYGFRDSHINKHLVESAKLGSEIIIIDTKPWTDFKRHIMQSFDQSDGTNLGQILGSISKYFQNKFDCCFKKEFLDEFEKWLKKSV